MKGTVDSGEIINQKIIKINEDDTSNSLYKKIISIMQLQIDEIIGQRAKHNIPQDHIISYKDLI